MINEEGEIENPNNSALRFFCVTPEEILGKNIFSLGGEDKKEDAKKFLQYHKSNVQLQHHSPPASVNFINCQPRDQTLWQIPQKISQFFGDYNTKTTMKIIQWRLCVCQN